jgi:hypothetical protein
MNIMVGYLSLMYIMNSRNFEWILKLWNWSCYLLCGQPICLCSYYLCGQWVFVNSSWRVEIVFWKVHIHFDKLKSTTFWFNYVNYSWWCCLLYIQPFLCSYYLCGHWVLVNSWRVQIVFWKPKGLHRFWFQLC